MAKKGFSKSRRAVLKTGALGTAALAAGALSLRGRAQNPQKVNPSDPIAAALHYVEDGNQAPKDLRTNPESFCHNCQFYQGEGDTGTAPCMILMNMLVPAQGWCASWVMKNASGAATGKK